MTACVRIIAGPNGAGKTTFAKEFLPNDVDSQVFINADLIAAGLSPFQPELVALKAGKLMLKEMAEYAARGESFAFETTLSGRGYVRDIRSWQSAGYQVELFFLALSSPELAIERVRERVRQGGHNVPEDVIRRRFAAGLDNFDKLYKPLVDTWTLYNNDGQTPQLLDWSDKK